MAEQQPGLESHEKLSIQSETVGIQARLLLGSNALSPEISLPTITKEQFSSGNIAYTTIDTALEKSRKQYWQDKDGNDFIKQKTTWTVDTQKRFIDYAQFWQGEKGKAWTETFKKIGLDTTTVKTDINAINTFYDTYFSPSEKTTTERFTDTIIQSYTTNGKLNYDALMEDKEAISWLAATIDGSGLDIVGEILTARANVSQKPDEVLSAINTMENKDGKKMRRIDNLRQRELDILTYISNTKASAQPPPPENVPLNARTQEKVPNEIPLDHLGQLDYKQVGEMITIDPTNPKTPGQFIAPAGGNMFEDTDTPTLAGRMTGSVYTELLSRPEKTQKSPERAQKLIEESKTSLQDFTEYLNAQEKSREAEGKPLFANAITRKEGTDGFHLDGKTYLREFAYYFNKSTANWKNADEPQVRAYITLGLDQSTQIQRHFVDLATHLYDQGIDFTAKAASPAGMADRTDNIVFYISASDQPQAANLIKQYLSEKGIGNGHVLAAQQSPQEGLSWALEPNDIQHKLWQEISGSSTKGSFNSFVAVMAMPTYLERLAKAQDATGDTQAATTYRQEAVRIQAIIEKYTSSSVNTTEKK